MSGEFRKEGTDKGNISIADDLQRNMQGTWKTRTKIKGNLFLSPGPKTFITNIYPLQDDCKYQHRSVIA